MRKSLSIVFLVVFSVVLAFGGAGCTMAGYTLAKRDSIDKAIATARADTEAKLTVLNEQKIKVLQDTIAAHETREQGASDFLFKGSVTFSTLRQDQISRPTLVMGQSIQQTSAQLPPATALAQAKVFKDLQTELDETKVSTEVLKTQYEKELGVARAEGEAKAKALVELDTKVKTVEAEKAKVLGQALTTEKTLQAAKDEIQNKQLADKTREAEQAKSVQAIKLKMSAIVGGLALLALAGAIWSPVWKAKFGAACGLLGMIAVGIWWIQPWHLAVMAGAGLVSIAIWAIRNHHIESKTATNLIHAIQTVKDTARDDYDRVLKPQLTEWMQRYDRAGNKVIDQAVVNHVDEVLMSTGSK